MTEILISRLPEPLHDVYRRAAVAEPEPGRLRLDDKSEAYRTAAAARAAMLRSNPLSFPAEQRPPMPIPDDFDAEKERRRLKQGGCCGSPSPEDQ